MTNASTSAISQGHTEPTTSRLTFSVKFLGMAPDEELLGLVRSFSARQRKPSSVLIERLPDTRSFRARVGSSGMPFEHTDPRLALETALTFSERNKHPASCAAS
jgi:hypothetical protein